MNNQHTSEDLDSNKYDGEIPSAEWKRRLDPRDKITNSLADWLSPEEDLIYINAVADREEVEVIEDNINDLDPEPEASYLLFTDEQVLEQENGQNYRDIAEKFFTNDERLEGSETGYVLSARGGKTDGGTTPYAAVDIVARHEHPSGIEEDVVGERLGLNYEGDSTEPIGVLSDYQDLIADLKDTGGA